MHREVITGTGSRKRSAETKQSATQSFIYPLFDKRD